MSATPENSSPATSDIVRDIVLWKRKRESIMVLLVATATWVVMEVYQFNFITVASWVSMFIVVSLFLWGNILRLLGKEPPNIELGISEQTAMEAANSIRRLIERGIQWMFRVAADRNWFVFAGTVAGLWLLSLVGSHFDLLTLLYIGVVMGMTVPVIYVKYEDKIKRYGERVKVQWREFCGMVEEKVIKKMKKKVVVKEKEKKVE